jgi:AraC-like DNA-binding protein
MLSGHYFKRIRPKQESHAAAGPPSDEPLMPLLSQQVIDRFNRIRNAGVTATLLTLPSPGSGNEPPINPCHPVCAEYADSDYCRKSWQLHLAELHQWPETHWHKCDQGVLCAIVPVVHREHCWAAVKLACSGSMAAEDFERHVELLDILVEGFVYSHADLLERLPNLGPPLLGFAATLSRRTGEGLDRQLLHPKVLKALEYIDMRLADPKLTIGYIARELDVDFSYLGRLFADQVGQRMSWFIAARRVELAKTLLATTDRQIKRIARDTGHANPNWFSHVFNVHTGLTPRQYRGRFRHLSPPSPRR